MAAQYGMMVFQSAQGGKSSVQVYLDDTAGNSVLFDNGGGDASKGDAFWITPLHGAIVDFILAAATTKTKTAIMRNSVNTGQNLLNAVYLASITTRPPLLIPYLAGQKIGMVQQT